MSIVQHNYGTACELRRTQRKRNSAAANSDERPPPLTTQFFYASRWHVDESFQSGSSGPEGLKVRLLPFTELDNARLEGAWRYYARSALGLGTLGPRRAGKSRNNGRTDNFIAGLSVVDSTVEPSKGLGRLDGADGNEGTTGQRPREEKDTFVQETDTDSPIREGFLAEGLGPDSTDEESDAPSTTAQRTRDASSTPNAGRTGERKERSLQRLSSSLDTAKDLDIAAGIEDDRRHNSRGQTFPKFQRRRSSEPSGPDARRPKGPGNAFLRSDTPQDNESENANSGNFNTPRHQRASAATADDKPTSRNFMYDGSTERSPADTFAIHAPPGEPPELVKRPRKTNHDERTDSAATPLASSTPLTIKGVRDSIPRSGQRVRFPEQLSDRKSSRTKLERLLYHFRDGDGATLPENKRSSRRAMDLDTPEPENRPSTPSAPAEPVKPFFSEPVGYSRLYMVQFPEFEMKPLYWDPTTDKALICRSTWFYKDSMRPVRQDLANELEYGYNSIKPWTETYDDEVKSCLSIGPEAEAKVVYDILSRPSEELDVSERDDNVGNVLKLSWKKLAVGAVGEPGVKEEYDRRVQRKRFVIYADSKNAQILGSNQLPAGKRKVLGQIREGKSVGVPVVRGFEQDSWEKLNLSKHDRARKRMKATVTSARRDKKSNDKKDEACVACEMKKEESRVSDLVLVVHGIGQQYSKKSENWRFMHAMNNLRSEVRKIRNQPDMQPLFRRDLGQIMILPVEWRTKFSPEGEGNEYEGMGEDIRSGDTTGYKLADVTCNSIPNVREIINDVMTDIPYYMSGHKEDMEQAMVQEANRIYRLWCRHNAGFRDGGRVHIVAHSLGSVMALSALSHQPTHFPTEVVDQESKNLAKKNFNFDTKNVFFCGSPVGFFLLLQRANLVPRRGRKKPGSEATGGDIGGPIGKYGCMAVDNVYNIIHRTDPISYRVNACVDQHYTSMLKDAFLPADQGWFSLWGRRGPPPLHRAARDADRYADVRPKLSSMPSTVEMEEHQFQREERAERRMRHLNDNGQIDWYVSAPGSGGPLEYLNILSAHSSYWSTPEFIRFLVIEVGREPGSEGVIAQFKARKKNPWKRLDPAEGPT